MGERLDTALCVVSGEQPAQEYAVVLAACGIDCRVVETHAGWAVLVAAQDAGRAGSALAAYEAENRETPRSPPSAPEYGRTWVGVVVALLLVAFYAATGSREAGGLWLDRGSASAERILQGEVWRTATALTLHADAVHVLGNAVACVIFLTAVGWWMGPGVALWLVLIAGAGGNALAALVTGTGHISVGASTATFGALGILAARHFAVRRVGWWARRTRWLVAAASLALLGMLGTGEHVDILGHLFGLLVGGAVGLAAALTLRRPPAPPIQWGLLAAAAASVIGAWWMALAPPPH